MAIFFRNLCFPCEAYCRYGLCYSWKCYKFRHIMWKGSDLLCGYFGSSTFSSWEGFWWFGERWVGLLFILTCFSWIIPAFAFWFISKWRLLLLISSLITFKVLWCWSFFLNSKNMCVITISLPCCKTDES